jgi:hypothetical protein
MKSRYGLAVALAAIGGGLNFLDAYFSGNLSFSPSASDQNNKVSVFNRLGTPIGTSKVTVGTALAVIGAALLVMTFLGKRR